MGLRKRREIGFRLGGDSRVAGSIKKLVYSPFLPLVPALLTYFHIKADSRLKGQREIVLAAWLFSWLRLGDGGVRSTE